MSRQETIKGKIRLVETNDIEEFAKNKINGELLEYYDSYLEQLLNDCDKYIEINGILYEVMESTYCEDEDIFEASKNEEGTISFLVSYYNGGCSFSEAIEIALKEMNNGGN